MRRKRTLRGRAAAFLYRLFTKRRPATTREGLAKQARRIMGLPRPLAIVWGWRPRIRIASVECGGVRCERLRWRNMSGVTLLYFHGGGYLCCSPQTHRPNTVTLPRLLNAETYVPDDRPAPEHAFPAAVDDAIRIYRALRASGAAGVVLAGDSAGARLVIATAIRARDEGLPLPFAILTFSPGIDLTPAREPQLRP